MSHALVKDSKIITIYETIPVSFENISNFHALSDVERADLGFVPVVDIRAILKPGRKYVHPELTVRPDKKKGYYVERSYSTVKMTQDEILRERQEKESPARIKRAQLLKDSDWTMLRDTQLTEKQNERWAKYRQDLRDITNQSGFPETVIWPTQPTKE